MKTSEIIKKIESSADVAYTDTAYAAYAEDMRGYGHVVTRENFMASLYDDAMNERRRDLANSDELAELAAAYGVDRVYSALGWATFIQPGFTGFTPENLVFLAGKCEEKIARLAEVENRRVYGEKGSLKDLARLFPAEVEEWEHSVGGDGLNDGPGYSRMCYRGKTIAGEMAIEVLRSNPEMRPTEAMASVQEAAKAGRPGNLADLARLFPKEISVTYDHHRDLRSGKEWTDVHYHGACFSDYGEKAVEILRNNPELSPVEAMNMAKVEFDKLRTKEESRKAAEEAARKAARETELAAEEARRVARIAEREARRNAAIAARREAEEKRTSEVRSSGTKNSAPEEKEDNFGAGAFDALAGLKF